MIKFVNGDEFGTKLREAKAILVPISCDEPTRTDNFKNLSSKYPWIIEKFQPKLKQIFSGRVYSISNDGIDIHFCFVKSIDKYGANLTDIIASIIASLGRAKSKDIKEVVMLPSTTKGNRISSWFYLGALLKEAEYWSDIDIFTMFEPVDLSDVFGNEAPTYENLGKKQLVFDYYFKEDDAITMGMITELFIVNRGLKLSKSSMMRVFDFMYQQGYYQRIEWQENDNGGRWFRMFPVYLSAFINSGILQDVDHYTEGRTDFREGPTAGIFRIVCKTYLDSNKDKLRALANQFREAEFKRIMDNRDK